MVPARSSAEVCNFLPSVVSFVNSSPRIKASPGPIRQPTGFSELPNETCAGKRQYLSMTRDLFAGFPSGIMERGARHLETGIAHRLDGDGIDGRRRIGPRLRAVARSPGLLPESLRHRPDGRPDGDGRGPRDESGPRRGG